MEITCAFSMVISIGKQLRLHSKGGGLGCAINRLESSNNEHDISFELNTRGVLRGHASGLARAHVVAHEWVRARYVCYKIHALYVLGPESVREDQT